MSQEHDFALSESAKQELENICVATISKVMEATAEEFPKILLSYVKQTLANMLDIHDTVNESFAATGNGLQIAVNAAISQKLKEIRDGLNVGESEETG